MAILWSVSASDNQSYTEADVWPCYGQYQPQITSPIQRILWSVSASDNQFYTEADVWPFYGQYQPQITSSLQRLMCGHFMVSISLR